MARYEFLYDDVLGDDQATALSRVTAAKLLYYPFSILHRCALAWGFGLGHYLRVSWSQLLFLICIHGFFLAYMLLVRPLAVALLQWGETVALACEFAILVGAAGLLAAPESSAWSQLLLVGYFLCVSFMILPELMRWIWVGSSWCVQKVRRGVGKKVDLK
jgi:hypothetical protein